MKKNLQSESNNDNIMPVIRFMNAKEAKDYAEVIRDLSSAQKIKAVVLCSEDGKPLKALGDYELMAKVDILFKKSVTVTVEVMKLNGQHCFSMQSDIKVYNLFTIDAFLILFKTSQFLAECKMGMLN